MCKKTQFKTCPSKIDPCMIKFIEQLEISYNILACCCGHNRYPMTIIIKTSHNKFCDLVSGKIIPRKKRFYRKDKRGYYYIPEVSKAK